MLWQVIMLACVLCMIVISVRIGSLSPALKAAYLLISCLLFGLLVIASIHLG